MANKFSSFIAGGAMRLSAALGPRGMRVIARFNKYVTNPIQRRWAPYLPYYALIEHTGRKSGKAYRTPVMVFVEADALTVLLNYGTKSDWVRNIQAAGSATVVHRGKSYRLTEPRVLPTDSPELPAAIRAGNSPSSALRATITPAEPADV